VQTTVVHLLLPVLPCVAFSMPLISFPSSLSCPMRAMAPRAPAGRHLIVAEESPPRSLRPLSLARTSTTQASTFRSSSPFANSRAPDPNPTAASLLPLRQRSALPWAAATRHPSPPSTPVRAFPFPTGAHRPFGAP
jgi:hypothetical protein